MERSEVSLSALDWISRSQNSLVEVPSESCSLPEEEMKHSVYTKRNEIPYIHVDNLGHGSFGIVDSVQLRPVSRPGCDSQLYARKTIRVSYWDSKSQISQIITETQIASKLRHRHIVRVVATYECCREYGIVMEPVAENDLHEFLAILDSTETPADRTQSCILLQKWTGCLIAVMEFLHSHKIKHKDVKPANILVRGDNVLITDFGIARAVNDESTTASIGTPGVHSPMYCAPEVAYQNHARGRAVDIFSLGCVLLEMLITTTSPGMLRRFNEFRFHDGSRAYAANAERVTRWIIYLAHIHPDSSAKLGMMAAMLDPEPQSRPTARELWAILPHNAGRKANCCTLQWEGQWVNQIPLYDPISEALFSALDPLGINTASKWPVRRNKLRWQSYLRNKQPVFYLDPNLQ